MEDRLGPYRLVRLVGQGGMGVVYEAVEDLSGRRVALKVLDPSLSSSEQARGLFLREIQLLARLEHPSLVRSFSCGEHEGRLALALEYVDGQSLRGLLSSRGRLPWHEAAGIAAQVASALGAIHGADPPVVHRDLKPENVLVTSEGKVKLADFGIAKILASPGGPSTRGLGTLEYMSPEQIDGAAIDGRADLYCLGLVLYEMLSGRPPFQEESPRRLLDLQCTAPPPPLPPEAREGLPRSLEQLLFELLAKSPARRPPDAASVLARLEPLLPSGSAPPSPAPPSPTREPAAPSPGPATIGTPLAVAFLVLIALAAGAAGYWGAVR